MDKNVKQDRQKKIDTKFQDNRPKNVTRKR